MAAFGAIPFADAESSRLAQHLSSRGFQQHPHGMSAKSRDQRHSGVQSQPVSTCTAADPRAMPLRGLEDNFSVAQMANATFGFNGWASAVTQLSLDYLDEIREGIFAAGATAVVRVQLKDGTFHEDVGFGEGDGPAKGRAIAEAKKLACRDALACTLAHFGNIVGDRLNSVPCFPDLSAELTTPCKKPRARPGAAASAAVAALLLSPQSCPATSPAAHRAPPPLPPTTLEQQVPTSELAKRAVVAGKPDGDSNNNNNDEDDGNVADDDDDDDADVDEAGGSHQDAGDGKDAHTDADHTQENAGTPKATAYVCANNVNGEDKAVRPEILDSLSPEDTAAGGELPQPAEPTAPLRSPLKRPASVLEDDAAEVVGQGAPADGDDQAIEPLSATTAAARAATAAELLGDCGEDWGDEDDDGLDWGEDCWEAAAANAAAITPPALGPATQGTPKRARVENASPAAFMQP
eukprot:m.147521 g.147521  ORF g.147521 m.147521 type:complete len:464 (+) comp10104_c1_seq8:4709-6100(+)